MAYILCHQRPPFHYDEAIAAPRPVPPALTEQKVEETLTGWTAEITRDDEQRAQAQEWESRSTRLVTHWNAPLQAPDRWPSPEPPVMRVADSEALRRVFTLEELQLEDEEREKTREYNIDMLEKTRRHHRWEEQEQQREQQEQQQQQQQQQQYPNGHYYEAPAVAVTASYQPPTAMEPSPHWGRWEQLEQLEEQQQQPYGPFGGFPFAAGSFLPPIFRRWRPWEH
ncbi:hypothetical protein PG993_000431 [Apiospora rasikravindrae]|uniref:Uncharacterized protein n=1 Tax=Apiospora rasikravindrae TaxID=990691 RepID=A0ABR1UBC4_9PEZI